FLNASQITSKNESYAVKNIKVIDCYFFIDETSVSAMDINKLENLTIKGCNFEHVAYNAIQVGHQSIRGNIEITNNVFNYTGSRVLYFVNTEDFTSCNVSDNYFSNNESCDKADGVYIKVGGTETIILGKNYWRAIPETGYFYFNGSVEYDYYEQETWGN
ncbi:MAG: hypothetical protein IJX16_00655, partial [Clostridia bacterium]|nr:hypothetical protein [Clostridia bacterium]